MNNYEFLTSLLSTIPEDVRNISITGYVIAIIVSLTLSVLISGLYVTFFDPNSTGSKIHRSFPLLGPAVTTIFITVQFSLPLSLGLLGALSIVRFRTPIKEPEEIGFILLVIACSISVATFNIAIAALLLVIVFIFLVVLNRFPDFSWLNTNSANLSLLIPLDEKGVKEALQNITGILTGEKLKFRINNLHSDEQQTSVTIMIKKFDDKNINAMHEIKDQNPQIILDLYRK